MKLAEHYRNKAEYAEALRLYNKILRKDFVKPHLGDKAFAEVSFNTGYLYSRLNLLNAAIESYARGSAKFSEIDLSGYYSGKDLDKDKLLAVGLLEGGRFKRAVAEFQKLKQAYPFFQEAGQYINAAKSLEAKEDAIVNSDNFYFAIGDFYIQNRLFDEARSFFTRRALVYGVAPLSALGFFKKTYEANAEIKRKVWGDKIYVTLEDFETTTPRLGRWVSTTMTKVNGHHIAKATSYMGRHSELLDVAYDTEGEKLYDYWAKDVRVPLCDMDMPLGIRIYVKANRPSEHCLKLNYIYPKQGAPGVVLSSFSREMDGGWVEYRIENLAESAAGIASRPGYNWNAEGVYLEKVILDTKGISDRLYIDEIELYLV